MPPQKPEHISDLEALARPRFPELTAAEIKLLQAAHKGEIAVCGRSLNFDDMANNPSTAEHWGTERQIRAELIRWLCVDRQAKELVDPRGIHVFAAKISEALDLSHVIASFPLIFACCSLDSELNLRYAEIMAINLQGTWVHSMGADGVQVKKYIHLRKGFHASGEVRLPGARIGGNLDCDGGSFENPALPGAPDSGLALVADGAIVNGAVFLRNGFNAVGEVRLLGAQIGGYLDCMNATFRNPPQGQFKGSGIALNADGMLVKGSVFLRTGFLADGEVRLLGAQIEGNLDCTNATISNPGRPDTSDGGHALNADRAVVEGGVFLRNGFRADGEVRLLGAQIGGDLDCNGGKFKAPLYAGDSRNRALSAHTVTVRGNVFLHDGFHTEGEVGFPGAQIAGNLECTWGMFHGALNLESASIRGVLFWRNIADPERARLCLMNASVGVLADDIKSWPVHCNLELDGFVYERISIGPKDAKTRLEWLARQESFAPQPHRQLAKVLRDEGDDAGARLVLIKMEDERRRKEDQGWLTRTWNLILRLTIEYGYSPGRALRLLAALVLVGTIFFWVGYHDGSMVPTDANAYSRFEKDRQLPPQYDRFHALIYSMENSFPLVKLGQIDRWQPDPNQHTFAGILRWFRWLQILLGWVLATLFVAGVTGIVRRN